MRRFRIVVIVLFILSALLLAASTAFNLFTKDRTLPVIQCPETPLHLSVYEDAQTRALEDVTASDGKDGDLTNQIFVQSISKASQGGTATITYAVTDSDNHVATATRTLHYTDYTSPRFYLSQALRYTVGSPINIRDRLTAMDAVDGDLSSQIKITSTNLVSTVPGSYPVTFEVTNSLGDTSTLTASILIQEEDPNVPQIYLTQYIVYTKLGEDFDPMVYLHSVAMGSTSSVSVQMPTGGLVQGTNEVVFTCPGVNNAVGSTILYVIAE